MYGELGYATAYVHLFYVFSCVERKHVKQMNVCCRITKFTIHKDSNFNQVILTRIEYVP
jgi:hypothetical protein